LKFSWHTFTFDMTNLNFFLELFPMNFLVSYRQNQMINLSWSSTPQTAFMWLLIKLSWIKIITNKFYDSFNQRYYYVNILIRRGKKITCLYTITNITIIIFHENLELNITFYDMKKIVKRKNLRNGELLIVFNLTWTIFMNHL